MISRGKLVPSRSVLVLEDDFLVGMELAEHLERMGLEVVGPFGGLEVARNRCFSSPPPDLALLDVNIRGHSSLPLALELGEAGMPCVFVTGYSSIPDLPDALARVPKLTKPVDASSLRLVVSELLGLDV